MLRHPALSWLLLRNSANKILHEIRVLGALIILPFALVLCASAYANLLGVGGGAFAWTDVPKGCAHEEAFEPEAHIIYSLQTSSGARVSFPSGGS